MIARVSRAAAGTLLCVVAQPAWPQSESYPTRPMRFIAGT